jgi:tetratricopeptide (TPR) repeat protein
LMDSEGMRGDRCYDQAVTVASRRLRRRVLHAGRVALLLVLASPDANTPTFAATTLSPTPWPSVALRGESSPEEDADALERNMVRAFAAGRYERALEIIDQYLGRWPETPHMHYNRACAFAKLGRPDAAGAALLAAVEHGFRDFETMRHDPDLASMRDHEVFTAILEARERVDRSGMDRRLDSWKRKLGDEYVYETDDVRRLQIATGLGRRAHAEMMTMIARLADEQSRTLFPDVPLDWCLMIVPSSADTAEVFKEELGVDDPNRTPGVYQHGKRMLVSRDIGASMRHEFTHRMHWADMDRRRQRHAMWVQEGLAGLYEDYRFRADGSIEFVPNIRHNIARRQVTANMDLSFEKLFRLDPDAFLAGNARYYPQVRSLFEFLADVGMLETW